MIANDRRSSDAATIASRRRYDYATPTVISDNYGADRNRTTIVAVIANDISVRPLVDRAWVVDPTASTHDNLSDGIMIAAVAIDPDARVTIVATATGIPSVPRRTVRAAPVAVGVVCTYTDVVDVDRDERALSYDDEPRIVS